MGNGYETRILCAGETPSMCFGQGLPTVDFFPMHFFFLISWHLFYMLFFVMLFGLALGLSGDLYPLIFVMLKQIDIPVQSKLFCVLIVIYFPKGMEKLNTF